MGLIIRILDSLEEIHRCEELQQLVWGFSDISVIPHHLIRTTIDSGGLLLGAFQDDRMIGFTFSFPGFLFDQNRSEPKLKHCSIMAAVLPEYRFQGIGYQLKLKQRELILKQGIDLVTWTFDPLQSSNAYFNFQKLGVICREYKRDFFGDMRDQLNKGLPSDRYAVEWWLNSPRVRARIQGSHSVLSIKEIERVNETTYDNGVLHNKEIRLDIIENKLLVEIPRKIGEMKTNNFDDVLTWRLETRQIFEHYLPQGYIVADLLESEEHGQLRSFYLLEKASFEEILKRI